MTRNRDLYLEDLFGCKHELTLPISENGEILYWRCTCGRRKMSADDIARENLAAKDKPNE